MRGVQPISVPFERHSRGFESLRRPAQIPRGKRDLSLGDDASRSCRRFLRTEGTSRSPQQILRPRKLSELRHGNAAQSKRGCVVAQRDPLQRGERIAGGEGASCGCNQRVHPNPVTLVTPTSFAACITISTWPAEAP